MKFLKRYLVPILLVFAALFPFVFYSSEVSRHKDFSTLERIGFALTYPFETVANWLTQTTGGFFSNYVALRDAKTRLQKVEHENELLRIQLGIYSEVSQENQRLRKLLSFAKSTTIEYRACQIVGADPSFLFESIRLDCGSKDGISLGMGVISGDGVVGVIMRVYENFADVLLVTDLNSNLDVIVTRNRRRGILSGNVGRSMKFKYSERGTTIQVGDNVVTSGFTGPFPPGLAVGVVSQVSRDTDGVTQSMDVEPSVDISNTFEVLVLRTTGREFDIIRRVGGPQWMDKAPELAPRTGG